MPEKQDIHQQSSNSQVNIENASHLTEQQKKRLKSKCNNINLDLILHYVQNNEIELDELTELSPERKRYIESKLKESPDSDEQKEWQDIQSLMETENQELSDKLWNYISRWKSIRPVGSHVDDAVQKYMEICKKRIDLTETEKKRIIEDLDKEKKRNKGNDFYPKLFAIISCLIIVTLLCFWVSAKNALSETTKKIEQQNVSLYDKNEQLRDLQTKLKEKEKAIESLRSSMTEKQKENEKRKTLLDYVSSRIPIIITNIQTANTYQGGVVETDYGNTIFSKNTMYLRPKITYKGLKSGRIKVFVKLYKVSNKTHTLRMRNDDQPTTYSYIQDIDISEGDNKTYELIGWGNEEKGNYSRGSYRWEIWYGNYCLGVAPFEIY